MKLFIYLFIYLFIISSTTVNASRKHDMMNNILLLIDVGITVDPAKRMTT